MTVIEFKRPDCNPPKPEDPLLYTVELSQHSTIFFREDSDDDVDKRHAADTLFDATFHVFDDSDNCQLLVMIGKERSDSIRMPGAFETPEQKAWLARRLDSVYAQVTGERHLSILERLAAFFRNIFTQGDPK
jgi:hypothetical protein